MNMIEGKIFFLTKETVIDVWVTGCLWIQQREKYLYLYTYTHRIWICMLWKHTSIHLRKRMLRAYGFSLHRGNILRCQGDIFPSWVISESSFPHLLWVSHHHNQVIWKTGFQLHLKCIKEIEIKKMYMPVGLQQGSGFQGSFGPCLNSLPSHSGMRRPWSLGFGERRIHIQIPALPLTSCVFLIDLTLLGLTFVICKKGLTTTSQGSLRIY